MPNKRIMVVEDEKIVAEDIRTCIEEIGYSVCAMAASGNEAIEISIYKKQAELPKAELEVQNRQLQKAESLGRMAGCHPEWPQAFLGKPFNLKQLGEAISQALVDNKR